MLHRNITERMTMLDTTTPSFSAGFLNAPLLLDRVTSWFSALRARSEMERELGRMSDRELADIGLTRATALQVARRR